MPDNLQRFFLENLHVRGEVVHLKQSWKEIQGTSDYPDSVRNVLGEALAAISLLSGALKYKGLLSLQIRGTSPVTMLVAQASSVGGVRAIAQWEGEIPNDASFSDLFGKGAMVINVENHTNKSSSESLGVERYQSLVALDGSTLAACFSEYFAQSEQLKSRLWLAADEHCAAGLLLQSLPVEEQDNDTLEKGWEHAVILADTLTREELLTLEAENLLFRLYHEEELRVYKPKALQFECSCSQEKVDNSVRTLGESEANDILDEQGSIKINCEFCNTLYELDSVDVKRLFKSKSNFDQPGTGSVH